MGFSFLSYDTRDMERYWKLISIYKRFCGWPPGILLLEMYPRVENYNYPKPYSERDVVTPQMESFRRLAQNIYILNIGSGQGLLGWKGFTPVGWVF